MPVASYTRTKRQPPYRDNGRTVFSARNRSGVYMIYWDDVLHYVGMSGTDVYKAMYRHFQKWNDNTQVRVVYRVTSKITVRVIYTNTAKQAERLERAMIVKYNPVDNPFKFEQYALTPADETAINNAETAPIRGIVEFRGDVPF
jgi:hypothetical protein